MPPPSSAVPNPATVPLLQPNEPWGITPNNSFLQRAASSLGTLFGAKIQTPIATPAATIPTIEFISTSSDNTIEVENLMGEQQEVLSAASTILKDTLHKIVNKHDQWFTLDKNVQNALIIEINKQLQGYHSYHIGEPQKFNSFYRIKLTLKNDECETVRILSLDQRLVKYRFYNIYSQIGSDPNNLVPIGDEVISYHRPSARDEIPKAPSDVFCGETSTDGSFIGVHCRKNFNYYPLSSTGPSTSVLIYHQQGKFGKC